jgi:hypothetical protein
LLERVPGAYFSGGQLLVDVKAQAVEGWLEDQAGGVIFLRRRESDPRTLAALEREQAKVHELSAKAEEKERLRLEALRAQPRTPLTLAELEGVALPTVRQAAETLEARGGQVTADLRAALPAAGREQEARCDRARGEGASGREADRARGARRRRLGIRRAAT